jgi:hypothetical protein
LRVLRAPPSLLSALNDFLPVESFDGRLAVRITRLPLADRPSIEIACSARAAAAADGLRDNGDAPASRRY